MITLDAGVLIAFFDGNDTDHERAVSLLSQNAEEPLYLGSVTEAEVLVRAAQEGREKNMYRNIRELGVSVLSSPPETGVWLAQLRASTGAKLPDCYVILTAQQSESRIATFDTGLTRAARSLGIDVLR